MEYVIGLITIVLLSLFVTFFVILVIKTGNYKKIGYLDVVEDTNDGEHYVYLSIENADSVNHLKNGAVVLVEIRSIKIDKTTEIDPLAK
jgi:hypothetical protein